jgi:hypothetical protein
VEGSRVDFDIVLPFAEDRMDTAPDVLLLLSFLFFFVVFTFLLMLETLRLKIRFDERSTP